MPRRSAPRRQNSSAASLRSTAPLTPRNRICEEAQGRSSGAGVVVPALPGVAEPADSFAQAHGQLGDGLQPLESGLAEYPAAFFLFAFGQQQLGIAENAGQWIIDLVPENLPKISSSFLRGTQQLARAACLLGQPCPALQQSHCKRKKIAHSSYKIDCPRHNQEGQLGLALSRGQNDYRSEIGEDAHRRFKRLASFPYFDRRLVQKNDGRGHAAESLACLRHADRQWKLTMSARGTQLVDELLGKRCVGAHQKDHSLLRRHRFLLTSRGLPEVSDPATICSGDGATLRARRTAAFSSSTRKGLAR